MVEGYAVRGYSKRRAKQIRRKKAARRFFLCAAGLALGMWILGMWKAMPQALPYARDTVPESVVNREAVSAVSADTADISEKLEELLEKNEEAYEYVTGYAERHNYIGMPVDLTGDFISGEVPLLMQWDKRWGYDAYGAEMIGLAGCGPLCLEMAYLYFTEDTDMTPVKMAEFAYDNGYYTEQGTSWALWTEGTAKLGLCGRELSLDEEIMKRTLDSGSLIVCSMRPGDFTTTGHFILIRGYNEEGFLVNDPNRRSNSVKTWGYETLKPQIRNLWELSAG